MPSEVSLQDVVDELEALPSESTAYLNRETGEIITISDDDKELVESEVAHEEDLPDWQRDWLSEIQEVLRSDDYIPLPTKFDIHEYEIMRRFCLSIEDDELREELLYAIQGSGAFRRFKDMIYRRGIKEAWYSYRKAAIEDIAIEWLTEQGIAYK